MILAVLLLAVIVFDLAALRWGIDSRDGLKSLEWQRRQYAKTTV